MTTHLRQLRQEGEAHIYRQLVDTEKLKVVKKIKLIQIVFNAVKGIEFSRRGENFLVNTADRVMDIVDRDPEPLQKLQELVNKTMWKK